MSKDEQEKCWQLIFSISTLCGELACTISADPENRKWLAVDAKYVRDKLIEINRQFMNDLKLDGET